jgi:MYXO-CTERM domain-containing protein
MERTASVASAESPEPIDVDAGLGRVRLMLLVSGVCLIAQIAATDYGTQTEADPTGAFWLLFGLGLLWLVYRRHSRAAWRTVIVLSLIGAIIYAAFSLDSIRHVFLVGTYLGQALPLMAVPVRWHVHARP